MAAATIPNCKAYDPAFAGEMAVIIDYGMREMLVEQKDVFYYVTLMNENYAQPDLPAGVETNIVKGCYKFASYSRSTDGGYGQNPLKELTLMGSGAILTEVVKAAQLLAAQGVDVTVYSVTNWSELARDGRDRRLWPQRYAGSVAGLLWGGCQIHCQCGCAGAGALSAG
jgi:pyruvate dehydrogenase E1 component